MSRALLNYAGLLVLASVSVTSGAAERDICEGRQGPELIRCIEAAARRPAGDPPKDAARSAPAAKASPAPPAPPAPAAASAAPAPSAPPENCTGRVDEALRRCLAAGGRLSPEAATVGANAPHSGAVQAAPLTCDGLAGESLRRCVEAQARAPAPQKRAAPAQPQLIPCNGYTAADQGLCLARNNALVECRNRQKYPDHDVCMRSFMSRAPAPALADCSKLQARSRTHCDERNRVYQSCAQDKIGYFDCLAERLGADAVLTRRTQ